MIRATHSAASMPFYLPWKGANYGKGFRGHQLLILGESHYRGDDSELSDNRNWEAKPILTQAVIEHHVNGGSSYLFHRRIEQIFNGAPLATHQRHAFWHSLAFYNYVQALLPNDHSGRVAARWHESRPAFRHVISELKPSRVLVLGKMTWRFLSTRPSLFASSLVAGAGDIREWTFDSGERMLAMCTKHPTAPSRFSAEEWIPRVELLMA